MDVKRARFLAAVPGAKDWSLSPRLRRAAARVFPLRYGLLFGWGVFWFMPPFRASSRALNDWLPFEVGARTLVHWHGMKVWSTPPLHLYVDSSFIQIGPPPILLIAPFERFSPQAVALGFGLAMCTAGVAAVAASTACAKALTAQRNHTRLLTTAFVVDVALIAVWSHEMGRWRHLDDAMALLCISVGMWLCARRGPWWAIALLAGTGMAAKPWAVVALAFLFGLPRPQRAKTALLAMGAAAAWWAPFVIAAPGTVYSLASYHITPGPGSVLALVGVDGDVSTWLRPVQFGAGIIVATCVAARGRWTAAPLAGLAMRVGLDPYAYSYYGLGPLLAAVIADFASPRSRLPSWTVVTLTVEYAVPQVVEPQAAAVFRLAWCAVVLIALLGGPEMWRTAERAVAECVANHSRKGLRIPHLPPQVVARVRRSNDCHQAEGRETRAHPSRGGVAKQGDSSALEFAQLPQPAPPRRTALREVAKPAYYSSEGSQ